MAVVVGELISEALPEAERADGEGRGAPPRAEARDIDPVRLARTLARIEQRRQRLWAD